MILKTLELAKQGELTCWPNPMVGCIIAKDQQVIGSGHHHSPGKPHAEINALNSANQDLSNATLYVNLEPCCHQGKTGPCTTAIIESGIKHVVVGCLDPNPLVHGKGIAILKTNGIKVITGIEQIACQRLNRRFFYHQLNKKPYVIAKWAMSIDGKIATKTHQSKWITGDETRQHVQRQRCNLDAILIGAGTAIADNPQLTARHNQQHLEQDQQPLRIILDGRNPLPKKLRLFDSTLPGKTQLASTIMSRKTYTLPNLLTKLYQQGCHNIMIEGGSNTLSQFFDQDLVDEIQCYIAPKLIGSNQAPTPFDGIGIESMLDASQFTLIGQQQFNQDILLTYTKETNYV